MRGEGRREGEVRENRRKRGVGRKGRRKHR